MAIVLTGQVHDRVASGRVLRALSLPLPHHCHVRAQLNFDLMWATDSILLLRACKQLIALARPHPMGALARPHPMGALARPQCVPWPQVRGDRHDKSVHQERRAGVDGEVRRARAR